MTWSPREWADEHIVYFSDDFSKVSTRHQDANQGRQDVNVFDPTPGGGLLEPGQIYYWTITEVNDPNVWLGDIWSFTSAGKAKAVYPRNSAGDIPALDLVLRWEAGLGSDGHDVYFGTSWADANSATTATTGIYRAPTQALADVNYALENLDVTTTYYWRIDEVNSAVVVTGDVWSFTTGVFLIVDDFEPYGADPAMRNVWNDYWFDPSATNARNDALVTVETDPVHGGGQSMELAYRCYKKKQNKFRGSWAEASIADLRVGSDWTRGGIKALVLYFYGDAGNGLDHAYPISVDQMYVELVDGDGQSGIVKYPDMNAIAEASWHEWNVSLLDPNFSDVNLADIATIYIGFGGEVKTGQSEAGAGKDTTLHDTVWFDDIRLYPPRCVPTEVDLPSLGDFTEDCNTDYFDLDIMTTDWLVSDAEHEPVPPDTNAIAWYKFDEGSGTTATNSGDLGSSHNSTLEPACPNCPTWTTEGYPGDGNALDFDGLDDWVAIPVLNLNSNTVTITAWVKPVMAGGGNQNIYSAIVYCGGDPNTTDSGIVFGADTSTWQGNNEVCYMWGGLYWDWHTDLFFVDSTWNFVAMAVEPTKATLYLYDGTDLDSWTNPVDHPAEEFDGVTNVGWVWHVDEIRAVDGIIDDVRIYDYTLSIGEIMAIASVAGYLPNTSVANIFPKLPPPTSYDPNDPDIVDFRDYRILADNWLEQHPWP